MLIAVAIAACGTPAQRPAEYAATEDRPADWWIEKPVHEDAALAEGRDEPDAAVAVAAADADLTGAGDVHVASVDDGKSRISVREALEKEGASIDGGDDAIEGVEAEDDDGATYEDGVRVNEIDRPVYCAKTGKVSGMCFDKLAQCTRASKSCARTSAFACFGYRVRTSGADKLLCVSSYGQCDLMSDAFVENSEFSDVTECAIFRVSKKKAKKR